MANSLNLFPARVAIGRGTDSSGRQFDILQTPEFARALADLLVRVGGANGMSITEIAKELARRPSTLGQSSVPVSLTGSLAPKVLASVNIPAKAMGDSGMVRITTVWSVTNNANNKTIITRFGGTDISKNAVTTVSTYQDQCSIRNRTASSQIFIYGGFSFTGAAIGNLSIDTTTGRTVDIVAQLDDVADKITLEAYTVELIPTP